MKKLHNLLLTACTYTVIVLTLFYLFAAATDFADAGIELPMFAMIFGFCALISVAGLILEIEKIKKPLRILIHYVTLFVAFLVIFVISGNISKKGPAAVFSAVVIFTFLYAVIFLICAFAKRALGAADKRIDKRIAKNEKNKKPKAPYKSLYGSSFDNENR